MPKLKTKNNIRSIGRKNSVYRAPKGAGFSTVKMPRRGSDATATFTTNSIGVGGKKSYAYRGPHAANGRSSNNIKTNHIQISSKHAKITGGIAAGGVATYGAHRVYQHKKQAQAFNSSAQHHQKGGM